MKVSDIVQNLGLTAPPSSNKEDQEAATVVLGPKKVFLEWTTEGRPEINPPSEKFMRTLAVIGAFIGFLLLLMREYALILVAVSIIVVFKALSQTPPEKVKYEVSSHGIMFDSHFYPWHELKNYFLRKNQGRENTLVASTKASIPGRLYLHYKKKDEEKLVEVFGQYLVYLEEEPKTAFDNLYDKVVDKFNLES